jgi:thiamine kinase-like enzyme
MRPPIVEPGIDTKRVDFHVELRYVVDDMLDRHIAKHGPIVGLKFESCADQTSFNLIDLEIEFADGNVLRLLLKDLGIRNLHETARRVKPGFLYDPLREIKTYEEILDRTRLGTARFYGAVVRPEEDRYWLFLEKISGLRLCQVRDFSTWLQAARWLAHLHTQFAGESEHLNRYAPLVRYDAAFYRVWLERFSNFQSTALRPECWEPLVASYEEAIERLIRLPSTLIHGEFYASNILVEETREGCRICPVDWETAAYGPGLIDLAALTAGAWSEQEQTEMAATYHDALLSEGTADVSLDDLLLAVDDCRLHLAIRWLGWAPDWSPPRENMHDWLGEAITLTEKMRIR